MIRIVSEPVPLRRALRVEVEDIVIAVHSVIANIFSSLGLAG